MIFNIPPALAKAQALHKAGRYVEAEKWFLRALAERPNDLITLIGLGSVCLNTGRPMNAFKYFAAAAELDPKPSILTAAGSALRDAGKLPEAERWHSRATHIDPQYPEAYYNLGLVYTDTLNKWGLIPGTEITPAASAAIECFTRFMALEPLSPVGPVQMAVVYIRLGRDEDAEKWLREAMRLDPRNPAVFENLAGIYMTRGDFEQAEACYAAAEQYGGGTDYNGRFKRAQWKLKMGRYEEGFAAFETRHLANGIAFKARPHRWHGEDLAGKKIVITDEQGIGDSILFARYIHNMIARAEAENFRIALFARPRLATLYARSFGAATTLAGGPSWRDDTRITVTVIDESKPKSWPGVGADYLLPLGSLPGLFVRSAADLPTAQTPYLKADAKVAHAMWADFKARALGRKIVGVSWRSASPNLGGFKSAPLKDWVPLLRSPGFFFVNMQYGDTSEIAAIEAAGLGPDKFYTPPVDPLKDFDGSAAAIAATDMMICTSSAAAHLAGALAVPTHLLLPFDHDPASFWYWGHGVARAPFYPLTKLHRATKRGVDWHMEALAKVSAVIGGVA